MKVLICGGRDFSDFEYMSDILNDAHIFYDFTLVIEGGAKGADSLARKWAESKGIPVHTFPADWKFYGKRAGFVRNQQMIDEGQPDIIFAFPGGNGTQDMINRGKKNNISVYEVN